MKKAISSVLASLFVFSIPALADVNIKIEDGISVLAINGKEVSGKNFISGEDVIKLHDGVNQLLVQYTAEIKTSADDFELESTDPFVLLLDAADKQLVLAAPLVKTEKNIAKFNELGNWKLLDSQGKSLALTVAPLKKEGFQLARNYEYELADFNMSGAEASLPNKQAIASMPALSPAPVIQQAHVIKVSNANKKDEVNIAEEMLRYWYDHADFETRKRFKEWINQ